MAGDIYKHLFVYVCCLFVFRFFFWGGGAIEGAKLCSRESIQKQIAELKLETQSSDQSDDMNSISCDMSHDNPSILWIKLGFSRSLHRQG